MKSVTRRKPKIWGSSIVGFGSYHYKYESSREGDMLMTGFSPRSKNLVVYVMPGFERYSSLMKKLGKHKTGKSCLYFKKLEDVDTKVLKELVSKSYGHMKEKVRLVFRSPASSTDISPGGDRRLLLGGVR